MTDGVKNFQDAIKAEDLNSGELDLWLSGKRARRILVIPFGGPLPGGKAGLDLDGEYFHEDTDLYGEFPTLRRSRERLVDWHHDNDPTNVMKGAIVGRIVLDEKAASDGSGVWSDFWANAGEKRMALVAMLERGNVPLFGSSQAITSAVRGGKGHIDPSPDGAINVWPVIRHTITTSPQNTFAVVPPLKAILTAGYSSDALSREALEAALLGPDSLGSLRALTLGSGERAGTASSVLLPHQERALGEAVAELRAILKH